jgi:hypothetical protein
VAFFIQILDVRHGWLDVELHLASEQRRFGASHVLNDPVRELAELALALVNGEAGDLGVEFWLEPNWLELHANASRDVALELIEIDDMAERSEVLASEVVDPTATAREILRCLQIARQWFPPAPDAGRWNAPFPDSLLSKLEKALL